MRTSRLMTIIGASVTLFVLGTTALAPNARRTPVLLDDGRVVTVVDSTGFVRDNWIAFALFGGSAAMLVAAILYPIITRRKRT